MNAIFIFIAVIVIIGGIVAQQKQGTAKLPTGVVPPTTQDVSPTLEATTTATLSPKPLASATPTQKPTPTQTASSSNSLSLDAFIYPNASIKNKSSTSLFMESADSPDAITSWYKEKIKSAGMTTRSFVQTSTNGNINNVLAAASGTSKISLTIKKSAQSSTVTIDISM